MSRRSEHREMMTKHLVKVLKKEGKLGEFLERELPTNAGKNIQKLISKVANEIRSNKNKT